jgi:hypothetical protein
MKETLGESALRWRARWESKGSWIRGLGDANCSSPSDKKNKQTNKQKTKQKNSRRAGSALAWS